MAPADESTQPLEETALGTPRSQLVLFGLLPDDSTRVPLTRRKLILGRGADCDLVVDARSVSRQHAELSRQGAIFVLRDLGSANGTYVNARRVESAPIGPGMVLRLGAWLGAVEELPEHEAGSADFSELAPGIHGGPLLARILRPVIEVARSNLPILLVGATGVGKERIAEMIHWASGRRGPLHAVNCAALPATLAEAEFFGYEKGAFTGAARPSAGHLRAAHGGTLFLDEVTDLPLTLQPLLLRVLDQGEVMPLGQTRTVPFDGRVVSASHEPLTELVGGGRFRPDLAARLSGLVVNLPPLTQRRIDIPRLFQALLAKHASGQPPEVSAALYERLCLHDWPGNVRELELLARQLLALHGKDELLHRSHLPDPYRSACLPAVIDRSPPSVSEEQRSKSDRKRILSALQQSGGNVSVAAQLAGVSRQRVYRLLDGEAIRDLRDGSSPPDPKSRGDSPTDPGDGQDSSD